MRLQHRCVPERPHSGTGPDALGLSGRYYAWKERPDPPRTLRRIWLAGEIADVHKASGGTYGALRVTAEFLQGREIAVGHNAVASIFPAASGLGAEPDPQVPGAILEPLQLDRLMDEAADHASQEPALAGDPRGQHVRP